MVQFLTPRRGGMSRLITGRRRGGGGGTTPPATPAAVAPPPGATTGFTASFGWSGQGGNFPVRTNLLCVLDARNPNSFEGRVRPANGASVPYWLPSDGTAYGATAIAAPSFTRDALGAGRDAVTFDGVDDLMDLGQLFAEFNRADTEVSVAVAGQFLSTTGNPTAMLGMSKGENPTSQVINMIGVTGSQHRFNATLTSANPANAGGAPQTTHPFIMIGRHGSGNATARQNKLRTRINGVDADNTAATGETLTFTATNAMSIALLGARRANDANASFMNGHVCYVAVSRAAWSDAERDAIQSFLRSYVGIA